jgi:two-component system sensor histidine kinase KdpD
LNDQVRHITGVRVRETIPDWVVHQADEVLMIDLTPQALLHRLERGVVYGREKAERAMRNFFRESTLVALRELAMRETAHEVEHRTLTEAAPAARHAAGVAAASGERHKILVLITADPATAIAIRRAKRIGDFLGAECFAVAVQRTLDAGAMPEAERDAMEQHLNFARNLRIETRVLEGDRTAPALIDFARRNRVTQIFVARPRQRRWRLPLLTRDTVQSIVNLAKDMQVVIVSDRAPAGRA